MLSTNQVPGIFCTEFDAPESDSFVTNGNNAFGEQVFDISMTEIESEVEPDRAVDDIGRESVTFVCIHSPILSISVSLLVSTLIEMYST